jgi:hypothetical protein
VSVLPARGWDATSYRELTAVDVAPILLPWGTVKSQQFRFDGSAFAKVHETTQPGTAPAQAMVPRLPRDPGAAAATVVTRTAPTAPVDGNAVFDQYKRDHSLPAATTPRIDLAVDLDGDGRTDRAMLVDRDLVVSGPSIGGGRGYTFLTLQPFAAGRDIESVTVRDLTGQGAAMIVVRGVRHVTAAHGPPVDEEVLFIYALKDGALARVFGIETARSQGPKRMQGLVQFIPARGGRGLDIDVRPGRATGWTQASYPWHEDQPGGTLEPLLLPWGDAHALRYSWDGSRWSP